jgi:hypothetical protein
MLLNNLPGIDERMGKQYFVFLFRQSTEQQKRKYERFYLNVEALTEHVPYPAKN